MIVRYSWFTDGVKPTKDGSGRYVLHEDYAALASAYVALEKELEEVKAMLAQRESELAQRESELSYYAYMVGGEE